MTHWNGKKHTKKKGRQLSFQLGWFISSLVGWWPAFFPYEVDGFQPDCSGINLTEGVVAKIPLFYGSGVNPKSPSGLALGFSGWNPSTSYGSNTLGFFSRLHSSYDDTKANQCSKNNFFGRVTFKNKNKNKNTSWTLLVMIYIFLRVTLEKGWWSQSNDWNNTTKFSTTDSPRWAASLFEARSEQFSMCNLRTACNKNNYVR